MRSLHFAFLTLCGACSTTPGITLSATPNPLPGDGQTAATVVATVTRGGSPQDGATVHFTTSIGSFEGAASGTPQLLDVQTADGGKATAKLIPPRQGWGMVQLNASVSIDGAQPSIATSVPLAPANGLASTLTFSCKHQNIGAFVQHRQDTLHVLCTATARDINQRAIAKASVQTLTEAGNLEWARDDNGEQQFVYSVAPDAPPPKDVGPLDSTGKEQDVCPAGCVSDPFNQAGSTSCQGEPCWTDQTGLTHNPRDGIATLIAAVPGVKQFDNQGEPYVDMNDNGVRDPGEPYIDFNGNGKYDGPTNKVQDVLIWKTYRMIWSGEASVTPAGRRTSHDCFMNKIGQDVTVYLFDRNFNALAADGPSSSDGINVSGSCQGGAGDGVINVVADQLIDQLHPGVLFKADDGSISVPNLRSTWTQFVDYDLHTSFTGTPGQTCSISAGPHRAYDPGAPGIAASADTSPDAVLVTAYAY
jgi:hypothetical protein